MSTTPTQNTVPPPANEIGSQYSRECSAASAVAEIETTSVVRANHDAIFVSYASEAFNCHSIRFIIASYSTAARVTGGRTDGGGAGRVVVRIGRSIRRSSKSNVAHAFA